MPEDAKMYVNMDRTDAVLDIVREALCPAIDNAMTGCANEIRLELSAEGVFDVWDDGPGFDVHERLARGNDQPLVTSIFPQLFACRDAKKSTHLNACTVGIVVTNALSEWLTYETAQDGGHWRQRFEDGKPTGELEGAGDDPGSWQRIRFRPHPDFFEPVHSLEPLVTFLQKWLVDAPQVQVELKSPTDSALKFPIPPRASNV